MHDGAPATKSVPQPPIPGGSSGSQRSHCLSSLQTQSASQKNDWQNASSTSCFSVPKSPFPYSAPSMSGSSQSPSSFSVRSASLQLIAGGGRQPATIASSGHGW